MAKSAGKIVGILAVVLLMISGCTRKKPTLETQETGQILKNFKLEFFDSSFKITLEGLAAEKKQDSHTAVSQPAIEIKSKNFILEIRTGSKGTGELFLDPSTQAVMKIVIQNNVMITQKNPENSQTNFSATCEKLTYIEKDDTVVMEGFPQVIQGPNLYSADRITYTFKENKLRFEGNVQVRFKKETAGSN